MKENFKEKAMIFGDTHGWDFHGENQYLLMFNKTVQGKKVRLNIYYTTGTVHPIVNGVNKPSYKKASDKVLENVFYDPFKNPYEQKEIRVASKSEPKKQVLIPVQELIDKIDRMETRLAAFEQALIDHNIIPPQ